MLFSVQPQSATVGTGNVLSVGGENTARRVVWPSCMFKAFVDLFCCECDIYSLRVDIYGDYVPVPYRGDWATVPRLWGDMPNARAACCTGVTAICDHRDASMQAHTHKHGGGNRHLAHPRPSFRPFITDYQHAPWFNFFINHKITQFLFRIKANGGAGVPKHRWFHAALLNDAPSGSDIAVENGIAAVRI